MICAIVGNAPSLHLQSCKGCTPLRSLDRHRLYIVLTSYITENYKHIVKRRGHHNGKCNKDNLASINPPLTPAQVAERESFLPMLTQQMIQFLGWLLELHWGYFPIRRYVLEGLLLPNKSTGDESAKHPPMLIILILSTPNMKGISSKSHSTSNATKKWWYASVQCRYTPGCVPCIHSTYIHES